MAHTGIAVLLVLAVLSATVQEGAAAAVPSKSQPTRLSMNSQPDAWTNKSQTSSTTASTVRTGTPVTHKSQGKTVDKHHQKGAHKVASTTTTTPDPFLELEEDELIAYRL